MTHTGRTDGRPRATVTEASLPARLRADADGMDVRGADDEARHARQAADAIERLHDQACKWKDEACAMMARAMIAELAAARNGK